MIEIYRKSFHFARQSWIILLLLALLMVVADLIMNGKQSSGSALVVYLFLLYYFHRHFLFGETIPLLGRQKPAAGVPTMKSGRFILVSLGVMAPPLILAAVAALKYAPRDLTKEQTVVFFALLFFPLYFLSLSLFGTAMPAAVDRDSRYSLRSGLRSTFSLMWRLLLGPGLCNTLFSVALIALDWAETRMAVPLSPAAAFVQSTACVDAPLDASGILGTVGHVIRCGRVSGLEDAACHDAAGLYGDMQIGSSSLTRARSRCGAVDGSSDLVS